tara:strand:- start:1822 stop:2469 length:648 start_codon:yes stop_codon:yes gene_type:complete
MSAKQDDSSLAAVLARIGQLNNTAQKSTPQVLKAILKTVVEMLTDRGYTDIQSCQTTDEVTRNMEDTKAVVSGGGPASVSVYFHKEDKVGIKQLRTWLQTTTSDAMIIVSLEGPTPFTRREADTNNHNVQFFYHKELSNNITKHSAVPLHEKMTETQRRDCPHTERVESLPMLYTNDPVAKYYAYGPGDIIRITRTAGVQQPVYYYRAVKLAPAT